jgi:uncharacterized repeat protein (TIGR02543 family)
MLKLQILVKILCCIITFFTAITMFGQQNITINTDIENVNVAGNGSGTNGTQPFNLNPNNNTITIANNGKTGIVHGAYNNIEDVSHNRVNIEGGTVHIVHGSINDGDGNAIENIVSIKGGVINSSVFGGYANGIGNVINNVVIVSGSPTIVGTLYGGIAFVGGTASGNKLEMYATNLTVGGVSYFQIVNFYLPANTTNKTVMIMSRFPANLTSATVGIAFADTNSPPVLTLGDTITLISNVRSAPDNDGDILAVGDYFFKISVIDSALVATVTTAPPTYTVTFAGEGINIAPQTIEHGKLVIKPTNPSKKDYNFDGWFTDDSIFLNEWSFTTDIVTQDTTIWAKWTKITGFTETHYNVSLPRIYPNPTKSMINVQCLMINKKNIEIFDIVGRKHECRTFDIEQSEIEIDISQLANGMYFLKIDNKMYKIIKE